MNADPVSEFGPPVFASASVYGVHMARCEPCMYGQHDGGDHPWAGAEDLDHAAKTGQHAGGVCGCQCVTDPTWANVPSPWEPDMDEDTAISPCPECGEAGPCGYDTEGRPLIHVVNEGDE